MRSWLIASFLVLLSTSFAAAESPYVKFLKSGRVPPERMGAVLTLIAKNGDADDLAYVLEQATKKDGFPAEVKPLALEALLEAANTRNVKPSGDLGVFQALLADSDPKQAAARLMALKLVGQWKVEAVAGDIAKLLTDQAASPQLRQQALVALGQIGGETAETTFAKLTSKDNAIDARILAVAGLAQVNVAKATAPAISVLQDLPGDANPGPLVDAFLAQQNGASALAKAVTEGKVPADAAKLTLRHMYSVGRADDELVAALSAAAGINNEAKPLSPDELKSLVAEVAAKGDAARGELLFRRSDLSCMKCHAVSGAGGNIGPELSAVGQTSPIDYVVTSILTPELSVKEEYQLAKVITSEGKVHVGIIAEDNPDRIVLKDGDGKRLTIAKDGDEEVIRGGSLMPKGLANFLTHNEFLDLAKFVSELGKPGDYAIRSQPTVQRWRVLGPTPESLTKGLPSEQQLRDEVLGSDAWQPLYAKVCGELPLADATKLAGASVVLLQAEVSVTAAGQVTFVIDTPADGVTAWLGENALAVDNGKAAATLEPGTHKLTLRVDTAKLTSPTIKVLVQPTSENAAEYTVVGGP